MGSLIAREIVQSRIWIDPRNPDPPNLNYKETFPITVFDAVRIDFHEESPTLTEIINGIRYELQQKQPIFPGLPANHLMTYAGVPGAIGSAEISYQIPWDAAHRSHEKIPTEKAVGDLLYTMGLLDIDGNIIDPETGLGRRVRWSDIVGRPMIYHTLGLNTDGVVIQKTITDAINNITDRLDNTDESNDTLFNTITTRLDDHVGDLNNPHAVHVDQIGAVSIETFEFHLNTEDNPNPHQITKEIIGLGNADNTSDADKPISIAIQDALDIINNIIAGINDDVANLNYFVDATYDQPSGNLTLICRNGDLVVLYIPIDGLVYRINYDIDTKELVYERAGGDVKRVNLEDLFIRYIGSLGSNIKVEIDGDQVTGNQTIKAKIVNKSITANEIANNAITTDMLTEQSITTEKLKDKCIVTVKLDDEAVTTEKIKEKAVTSTRLADRAVNGRILFTSSVHNRLLGVLTAGSDPAWLQANDEMIRDNAIRTKHILSLNITSDKLAPSSVLTNKIEDYAVTNPKIASMAITNEKISDESITGNKLVDDIVIPGTPRITVRPADDSYTTQVPDTRWVKDRMDVIEIRNDNLLDRVVDGRVLFSSSIPNRALVVYNSTEDPEWGRINNDMMVDDSITTRNIVDLSVTASKLADLSVYARNMTTDSVLTNHIVDNNITSEKIFQSHYPNRVLAAVNWNSNPIYTQINREMIMEHAIGADQIEDHSITLKKLQSHNQSNMVIGIVTGWSDPMYVKVNNQMIQHRAVDGQSLFTCYQPSRVLAVGSTPNVDPAWLLVSGEMIDHRVIRREHINYKAIWNEHLQDKIIESHNIMDWTIQSNNIAARAITGVEMFTSPVGSRVLAITDVPYSDAQWLQVTTPMIEDSAVTGDKIFRSKHNYRVLVSTHALAPPEWQMITHQHIVDGTITGVKIAPNVYLSGQPMIQHHPRLNSGWDHGDVNAIQIPTTWWVNKRILILLNEYITTGTLPVMPPPFGDDDNPGPVVGPGTGGGYGYSSVTTDMLQDRCVTTQKLALEAVENEQIANKAITGNKLVDNIVLPLHPTVPAHTSYTTRSLRNTVLSPNAPSGGQNGDIWFRYI